MKKLLFFLIVTVGAITVVILSSETPFCASNQVVLKMAMYQPAAHPFPKYYHAKIKAVEKITNGRIKIKIYDSSTLLKSTDMDDGVNKGIADLGFSYPPMLTKSFPFVGMGDVPGIWRDSKGFHDAIDNGLLELYEEAFNDGGLSNLKIINMTAIGSWYIGTAKKKIRIPVDLKGLKIRAFGGLTQKYIDSCGGTSIYIPIVEAYEGLQRGIIDGVTAYTSNFVGWKWMEPCKYMLDYTVSVGPMMLIINKKSLEKKVPKELQQPVLETLELLVKGHRGVMLEQTIYHHNKVMSEYMEFYKPNAKEANLWNEAGKPVLEEWLSKTGDRGKKALEIVRKFN